MIKAGKVCVKFGRIGGNELKSRLPKIADEVWCLSGEKVRKKISLGHKMSTARAPANVVKVDCLWIGADLLEHAKNFLARSRFMNVLGS
jgi:hypothetical protein